MKLLIALCLVGAVAAMTEGELAKKYRELVRKYHHEPILQSSRSDQRAHYSSFKETAQFIEEHNRDDGEEWQADFNEFSIMTEAERAAHTGLNVSELFLASVEQEEELLEERSLEERSEKTVDWRSELPAPKNQGGCGSCWTFGAVAALEYQVNRNVAKSCHKSLSEQQYLDCVYEGSRDGCNGGWPTECYTWSKNNGNFAASSADKPYTGVDGKCTIKRKKNAISGFTIAGSRYVTPKTDAGVAAAVADSTKGVLSVAIGVVSSFYSYGTGVYSCKSCSSVNHAVDIVGYGAQKGVGYFLVRNSWGAEWGDGGYILMKRGLKGNINTCSLTKYAHYPAITGESDDKCDDNETTTEEATEESSGGCSWSSVGQTKLRKKLSGFKYSLDVAKAKCEDEAKCSGVTCNGRNKCQLNTGTDTRNSLYNTIYLCDRS